MIRKFSKKFELKKKKITLGPNPIAPVEFFDNDSGKARENMSSQTPITSLPATFIPAPFGYSTGNPVGALKGFTKKAKEDGEESWEFETSKPEVKTFYLNRKEDETGVSGTGKVAFGIVLPTGRVAIEWTSAHSSITIFENPEEMKAVHGHSGKTDTVFTTGQAPKSKDEPAIRPFSLKRLEDETGISGTGMVAYGAVLPSGKVIIEWTTENKTIEVFKDVDEMIRLHGHGGKTQIEYTKEVSGSVKGFTKKAVLTPEQKKLLERVKKERQELGADMSVPPKKKTEKEMKQLIEKSIDLLTQNASKKASMSGLEMRPAQDAEHFFHIYYKNQFIGTILKNRKGDSWGWSFNKFGPWQWGYPFDVVAMDALFAEWSRKQNQKTAQVKQDINLKTKDESSVDENQSDRIIQEIKKLFEEARKTKIFTNAQEIGNLLKSLQAVPGFSEDEVQKIEFEEDEVNDEIWNTYRTWAKQLRAAKTPDDWLRILEKLVQEQGRSQINALLENDLEAAAEGGGSVLLDFYDPRSKQEGRHKQNMTEQEFFDFYTTSLSINLLDSIKLPEAWKQKAVDIVKNVVDQFATKIIENARSSCHTELHHYVGAAIDPRGKEGYDDVQAKIFVLKDLQRKYGSVKRFDDLRRNNQLSWEEIVDLFHDPHWAEGYGKQAWAIIAKEAQKLEEMLPTTAENLKEIVVQTDHIIDLEHNSGLFLQDYFINPAKYNEQGVQIGGYVNDLWKLLNEKKEWTPEFLQKKSPMLFQIYRNLQRYARVKSFTKTAQVATGISPDYSSIKAEVNKTTSINHLYDLYNKLDEKAQKDLFEPVFFQRLTNLLWKDYPKPSQLLSEQDFYDFYAASHLVGFFDTAWSGTIKIILNTIENFCGKLIRAAKHAVGLEMTGVVAAMELPKSDYGDVDKFTAKMISQKMPFEKLVGLFDKAPGPYGGGPWVEIAHEALKLEKMLPVHLSNAKNIVAQADRLVDLEHNNGLFLERYVSLGNKDIYDFLSEKSESWNWDFFKTHSPQMYNVYQQLKRYAKVKNFTKTAQVKPGESLQKNINIQAPRVEVDPTIKAEVQDAIEKITAADPNYFVGVSKIVALHGGPFGQVSSEDPSVVYLNIQRIINEVKSKFGTFNANNPDHREAMEEAVQRVLIEVISHEKGHVLDWNPEQHKFPGGEGPAQQESHKMVKRLFPQSSVRGFCKKAVWQYKGRDEEESNKDKEDEGFLSEEQRNIDQIMWDKENLMDILREEGEDARNKIITQRWMESEAGDEDRTTISYLWNKWLKKSKSNNTLTQQWTDFLNAPLESLVDTAKKQFYHDQIKKKQEEWEKDTDLELKIIRWMWDKDTTYGYGVGGEWSDEAFERYWEKFFHVPINYHFGTAILPKIKDILLGDIGGHETITETMPGELPSSDELEKWFKSSSVKGFCKKAQYGFDAFKSRTLRRLEKKVNQLRNYLPLDEVKYYLDKLHAWEQTPSWAFGKILKPDATIEPSKKDLAAFEYSLNKYLREVKNIQKIDTSTTNIKEMEDMFGIEMDHEAFKTEKNSSVKGFCKKAQWKEEENDFWSEEGGESITPQQLLHYILFGLEEQVKEGDINPQWVLDNIDQWWKNACFTWEEGTRASFVSEIEDEGYALEEYVRAKIDGWVEEIREMLRTIELQAKRMAAKRIKELLTEQSERVQSSEEIPSAEELEKWFKASSVKGFCKTAQQKLTIGIDIDDVLADFHKVMWALAEKHVPLDEEDKKQYVIQDTKHGSLDLRDKIMEEMYQKHLIADMPEIPGAVEEVNKWHDAGHKIVLITARSKGWEDQTKEWLDKVGLKYDKLIITNHQDKAKFAEEEGVNIFIDDSVNFLENMADKGIKVYVFDQPWNTELAVPRIKNWKQVKAGQKAHGLEMTPTGFQVSPIGYENVRKSPAWRLEAAEIELRRLMEKKRWSKEKIRAVIEFLEGLGEERAWQVVKQLSKGDISAVIPVIEEVSKKYNADVSIQGFTKFSSPSMTIEVVRGIRGKLADLARKKDPIYATSMGKWNFWAEKSAVGKNEALDSYGYAINLETNEADGVVISKTITLKVDPETNSVIFPKGWGATTYGITDVERNLEYTAEPQRWHVIPGSNAREAEVADKIPMERLQGAEIVSKGTITDYKVVYDAKEQKQEAGLRGFTKFSSPRWSPEERTRLKELYLKYRQRGIPHHIIYKAAAYLLNKSWLAVKQKLESMYGLEDELKGMKFEHWDKNKIDQTIQDLYRGGKPISRLKLPPNLMYQITNHSMPKSESRNFPTYYDSFDNAMADNILIVGVERDGDKLTEKPIKSLEDALKYYRRKEKMAHTWSKDEILELLCEAHTAGLPLTYSFFRSHPDIYKPLLGVGRSLEGLRDSVKRLGCTWSDLVVEAAPQYAQFYSEDGRLIPSTEELRVRRFLELNNIPFRVAGDQDRLVVEDPELQILGYRHFIPDFIVLGTDGNVQAYVEVFGSIADSRAANTSELYREKKKAKEKFYSTLPYKFIAINNNADGIDLTDEILKEKFGSFLGV